MAQIVSEHLASTCPAERDQILVAELTPVRGVIAHPPNDGIALEYEARRLPSVVRRSGELVDEPEYTV